MQPTIVQAIFFKVLVYSGKGIITCSTGLGTLLMFFLHCEQVLGQGPAYIEYTPEVQVQEFAPKNLPFQPHFSGCVE